MTPDLAAATLKPLPVRQTVAGSVLGGLDHIISTAAALCLVGIVVDVFLGVVARYVFNASFTWTEEIGQLLFLHLIFLGVPLAHRQRMHFSIGLGTEILSRRWHGALSVLVDAVVAYTTINLIFSSLELMQLVGGYTPALQWPNEVKYAIIPTTGVIALLYLLLRGFDEGRQPWLPVLAIAIGAAAYGAIDYAGWIAFPRTSPSLVMAIAFCSTIFLGVPIAYCLLFSALLANWGGELLPPPAVVQNMVSGAGKFLLLAIPLFLMAGNLMTNGGLTAKIIDFAHSLVGHFRGGLAQVNVLTSLLFGGISGSSSADAALDSKIIVPQMVRHGYSSAFSCAITAASAVLPNVVPPSLAILIYAAVAEESVAKLFLAGIVPGFLLCFMLMGTVYVIARRRDYGRSGPKATMVMRGAAFMRATPVLFLAVLIVAGIRFGVVTPSEAGVIAVLWALFLGAFVYKGLTLREMPGLIKGCAVEAALIGLLVGVATPFAWVLIAERIPQVLVDTILSFTNNKYLVLLILNVIMLLAGTFLDLLACLLILVPLCLPLIAQLGIDPIHFGIITVINLVFGALTWPVGLLVFIPAAVTRTPVNAVFREVNPFLAVLIVGLMIITFVPAIPLTLVRWFG